MNRFTWNIFKHFVPREEGDGGDGDGDGGRPPGTGDGTGGGEGKPEWLPEKFYDPDVGPRVETLAKSFTELEGKFRSKKEDIAEEIKAERLANVPEKYEISLPEELTKDLPEGTELTLNDDDPVAEWFMGFAKENGLSQEEFSAAVNTYIGLEIAKLPNVEEEINKLGDYGKDRLLKVETHLNSVLAEDEYDAIQPMLTSAKGIEALEKLIGKAKATDFDGDNNNQGLTLAELRAMQNDPRYHRDKDPAFIKKVQDGYKRLYG